MNSLKLHHRLAEGRANEPPSQEETLEAFFASPEVQRALAKANVRAIEQIDEIRDYRGHVLAIQAEVEFPQRKGSDLDEAVGVAWATLAINDDGGAYYRLELDGHEITRSGVIEHNQVYWLRTNSEKTKVVKSRPPSAYPELFCLPKQEVWPKGKKVAVIGDPYQACDKEDTTLIEYAYAEEILPDIPWILAEQASENATINTQDTDRASIERRIQNFYIDLLHEDLSAVERGVLGSYLKTTQNPYHQACIAYIEKISQAYANSVKKGTPEEAAAAAAERSFDSLTLREIGKIVQLLKRGLWTIDDVLPILPNADTSALTDLHNLYEIKQQALEEKGNPRAWKGFVDTWESFLAQLPMEVLPEEITDRIEQVRFYLHNLPTSPSPIWIKKAVGYLQDFYHRCQEVSSRLDHETHTEAKDRLYHSEIADSRIEVKTSLFSDSLFGMFPPGFTIPPRAETTINRLEERIVQANDYIEYVLPKLKRLASEVKQKRAPLEVAVLASLLEEEQSAIVRDRYFSKRTQRAVPLHGFFPYDMPNIDQQDRILALTSVTMHGWNRLDATGFLHDIEQSLPFLKTGGKYILGPIDQATYFTGTNRGFDTDGLMEALRQLRADGKIEFQFQVFVASEDDNVEIEDGQSLAARDFSMIETREVLQLGEAAASLVITKR